MNRPAPIDYQPVRSEPRKTRDLVSRVAMLALSIVQLWIAVLCCLAWRSFMNLPGAGAHDSPAIHLLLALAAILVIVALYFGIAAFVSSETLGRIFRFSAPKTHDNFEACRNSWHYFGWRW